MLWLIDTAAFTDDTWYMATTHPPLVAYYGTLIKTTPHDGDDYVWCSAEARTVIPTLTHAPVMAVQPGDFLGDFIVMVPVPYVLSNVVDDDEYVFELDVFTP